MVSPHYIDFLVTATLAQEFPFVLNAADLLTSMQRNSSFQLGAPSPDIVAFLECAKHADPNLPNIADDDKDSAWGHYQLSRITSLLASWDNIGNTGIACHLIAVVIKTCKVAQHLCFTKQINLLTYLSDIYLSNIIASFWSFWKQATGINVSNIMIS